MKILAIADEESPRFWNYYQPGCLSGFDLILSAGDLKAEYLTFLTTMANRPLFYVHGNHDGGYDRHPPEGCECIDDRLVTVGNLRILGLGGSILYNNGPYQYTEKQMRRRIRKLAFKIKRAGGVDLVLTHAPVRGYGDGDDPAHRGFEAFLPLLDRYHPRYLVHGHVHAGYCGASFVRTTHYKDTFLVNAVGRFVLDTEEAALKSDTEAAVLKNTVR